MHEPEVEDDADSDITITPQKPSEVLSYVGSQVELSQEQEESTGNVVKTLEPLQWQLQVREWFGVIYEQLNTVNQRLAALESYRKKEHHGGTLPLVKISNMDEMNAHELGLSDPQKMEDFVSNTEFIFGHEYVMKLNAA